MKPFKFANTRWWGLLAWAALALPAAAQDEPTKTPPAAEQAGPAVHVATEGPAVPATEAAMPVASHAPSDHGGGAGSGDLFALAFVFMLATFIGIGVIRRVSRLLHTPLMSLTNAISAISVVGAIIVTGGEHYPTGIRILGAVALFASMTNIISGFLITDRMLKMFKTREGGKA